MPRCFDCGDTGHMAYNCPNRAAINDGRPIWCGTCDEHSRHVQADATGDAMKRCHCHPGSHKMLPQHRRCPSCRTVVYTWNTSGCDGHRLVGAHLPYAPPVPPRGPDHERLRLVAAQQVAEFREQRAEHGLLPQMTVTMPPPGPVQPLDRWSVLPGDPPRLQRWLEEQSH